MKSWIFLLLILFGCSFGLKAEERDIHDSYKESFSSTVGFFGADLSLNDVSGSKHSRLKSHFVRINVLNNSTRSSFDDLVSDFDLCPFSLFSVPIFNRDFSNYDLKNWKKNHLYKLFNNYRI